MCLGFCVSPLFFLVSAGWGASRVLFCTYTCSCRVRVERVPACRVGFLSRCWRPPAEGLSVHMKGFSVHVPNVCDAAPLHSLPLYPDGDAAHSHAGASPPSGSCARSPSSHAYDTAGAAAVTA